MDERYVFISAMSQIADGDNFIWAMLKENLTSDDWKKHIAIFSGMARSEQDFELLRKWAILCSQLNYRNLASRLSDAAALSSFRKAIDFRLLVNSLCDRYVGIADHYGVFNTQLSLLIKCANEFQDPLAATAITQILLDCKTRPEGWLGLVEAATSIATRANPASAEPIFLRAVALRAEGQHNAAAELLAECIRLEPDFWEAHIHLFDISQTNKLASETASLIRLPEQGNQEEIVLTGRPSVEDFIGVFEKKGCCIVRGLVDISGMDELVASHWTKEEKVQDEAIHIYNVDEAIDLREQIEKRFLSGGVFDYVNSWLNFAAPMWQRFISNVWQLQMQGPGALHYGGLSRIHQDTPAFFNRTQSIHVWMPLVNCGPDIAPSLTVYPLRARHPVRILEEWPDHPGAVTRAHVFEYMRQAGIRPTLQQGDVIFFNKYNFHATFKSESMPANRYSLDIRYGAGPILNGSLV